MNVENITALEDNPYVSVDNADPEQNKPEETITETPVTNTEVPVVETPSEPIVSTPPQEIEIEGLGKVKIDDIREWQKGNMRQSDYTRKTQEVAKQREEMQDALEVFNYLKSNPNLVNQLRQLDNGAMVDNNVMNKTTPENDILREVYMNQRADQLDREMGRLKEKYKEYGDVDEVELYNRATELKVPIANLETVYRDLIFDNAKPTSNTPVDESALREKIKQEIMQELQQNRSAVQTIVSQPGTPVNTTPVALTPEEHRVAQGMRMSDEEYAKWKQR